MLFDIFDIFDNAEFIQLPINQTKTKRCPVCDLSYNEFMSTGKLGCSECYKTFEYQLDEVLRQLHRNPVHTGKIPFNLKSKLSKKKMIENLKKELQAAVKAEEYEEAARIHKEILELEKEGAE